MDKQLTITPSERDLERARVTMLKIATELNGEVDNEYPDNPEFKLTRKIIAEALAAERAPLVKALKEVREAIIQNATDTLWMHDAASPNCTVVDWIDLSLGEDADEAK